MAFLASHPRMLPVAASVALLATACLFVAAGAQDVGEHGDPHAAGRVNVPAGASEVAYCRTCHTTGCTVPHPELVKLTWTPQGKVVLGVSGEITCGSCHTRGFKRRSDAFLAPDQKRLCNNCHFGAHALSDAHNSNQPCEACHAKAAAARLNAPTPDARVMSADVNAECLRCHYDGPVSHKVGIPNTKKKAPDLPLSADGKITCVTCHFGHDKQDKFGKLLRKDNRRGGLCLSCHDDL